MEVSSMNIVIDEKAREFMTEKGIDTITIKLEKFGGGWAGCTYVPAVVAGKPEDISQHTQKQVDGVNIYISPFISVDKGLKVYLSGFSVFKGLRVVPLI